MHDNDDELDAFLSGIGLEALSERFRTEDIDMSVLLMLDPADLRELGLTLGQRKKITLALQERAQGTTASAQPDTPIRLRRLSVLFADIVGSTDLGERLGIDEMQALLQHYYDIAHRVARDHGGHVSGTQGDGVVMLFGFPRVIEGIAERCIQAGLALQATLKAEPIKFPGREPVTVTTRIGVATGQAAVGQARAGDQMHLVGPVVNRAARLQTVAAPGGIVVDETTRELTRTHVRYGPAESHDLKGLPGPVEVSPVQGLGEREGVATTVDLLGRQQELAELDRQWKRACAGAAVTLDLTGDSGIGKTALLSAWRSSLSPAPSATLHLQGAAIAAQSPFWPVIEYLRTTARGSEVEADAEQRRPMTAPPDTIREALLSETSGAGTAEKPPDRKALLAQLADWIAGVDETGGAAPRLLVLDNAQWADDSTRALLAAVERTARKRSRALLIVRIAREAPGTEPSKKDAVHIRLGPLSAEATEALVHRALAGRPVPQALRDRVLDHASGNPLMIEALTRALETETGDALSTAVEVPFTIYESVAKRLDDIGEGRRLIEALAVLNRPTGAALLAEVAGTDPGALTAAMAALEEVGLVRREHCAEGDDWRIHHQLYRDVIYEQIAGESRQALHQAAFEALTDTDDGTDDALALHAHAARAPEAAARHALAAGEALLQRSALIEAQHFLEMARGAIAQLPIDNTTRAMALRCVTGLASIERSRFGIFTDVSEALGHEAARLARELGDARAELLALNGLYAHALVRAEYGVAEERARALLDTAEKHGAATFSMIGTRATGAVAFHRGDYAQARERLQTALDLYDEDRHLALAHAHGYDHAEICAAFLSLTLWMQGEVDAAHKMSEFAVAHSRRIDHAHSLAQAMAFRTLLGSMARDTDGLCAVGPEAAALSEKHGIRVMHSAAMFFPFATRLCTRADPPDADELERLDTLFGAFKAANPFNYGPLVATLMADAMLRGGRADRAEALLREGAEIERRSQETWTAPELLRMQAALARHRGDAARAGSLLDRADDTARAAGARMLTLRIACDRAEAMPGDGRAKAGVAVALHALGPGGRESWDGVRAAALVQTRRQA